MCWGLVLGMATFRKRVQNNGNANQSKELLRFSWAHSMFVKGLLWGRGWARAW